MNTRLTDSVINLDLKEDENQIFRLFSVFLKVKPPESLHLVTEPPRRGCLLLVDQHLKAAIDHSLAIKRHRVVLRTHSGVRHDLLPASLAGFL